MFSKVISTLLEILGGGRDSALACYIAFQVAFQPFLRFWGVEVISSEGLVEVSFNPS